MWVAQLVAVGEHQVVGFITSSVIDDEGHIDQVSVSTAAARQGVGATLIEEVCAWSRTLGHRSVTLTTFLEVAWNAPYYERLGFSILAPEDCGPGLAEIRRQETRAGIDVLPRVAMRKSLI